MKPFYTEITLNKLIPLVFTTTLFRRIFKFPMLVTLGKNFQFRFKLFLEIREDLLNMLLSFKDIIGIKFIQRNRDITYHWPELCLMLF